MKATQAFRLTSIAFAAALTAASSAHATSWFGFEGGSQLINCALGECFRPPDTMGAVGTTQFLETANGYIRIYDKTTGAVQSSVNMATFWANAGLPGGAGGDQRVLFDHYTNRWIMSGFGSNGGLLNIAVSDTANALGTWKSTQISGAAIGVPATTLDYPTLGMDDKGVYIGTNNFPNAGGFSGTSLLVIPKASLFGGASSTAGMTVLTTPYLAGPDNGFAIQAAVNWQGNPTNTASVMADSRDTNSQVFYRLGNVAGPGAATQTPSSYIAGAEYTTSGPGRQPDGTRLVDTLQPRITGNVVQVNGRLYSAIAVNDGTDHSAVRWSVNDALTGAIIETGMISGGGFDYYEGSIAVNEFGQAVIGYNRSGYETADNNGDGLADGNISFMARVFETDAGGGLDQVGSDLLLKVSTMSNYHCGNETPVSTTCRQRWGDYSAVTIDPNDHRTFYAIGEYASEWALLIGPDGNPIIPDKRAIWNTYIAAISVPVPEPASYALMLAGLAAVGAVARRRSRGKAGAH